MSLWQPELNLKLTVKVVLLGLGSDHAESVQVDASTLKKILREVLPSYYAPVIPTERQTLAASAQGSSRESFRRDPTSLKVKYDIDYEVKHASEQTHGEYLTVLANDARLDASASSLLVPISQVGHAIEELAVRESGMSSSATAAKPSFSETEVTLLVANPNRQELHRVLESLGMRNPSTHEDTADTSDTAQATYSFAEAGSLHKVEQKAGAGEDGGGRDMGRPSTCARSWTGQGRVLVLDLGAAACDYGATEDAAPHSTVSQAIFPSGVARPDGGGTEHWLLGSGTGSRVSSLGSAKTSLAPEEKKREVPDTFNAFSLKLSSLIVSATRTVLAPAVPASAGREGTEQFVVVPILMFREDDGGETEGTEGEKSDVITNLSNVLDEKLVSEAVNAMALPRQEIVVVSSFHDLSEHPQVAVALKKSLATRMKLDRPGGSGGDRSDMEASQNGYIDSARLLVEMKSAGDELASSLLSNWRTRDEDTLTRVELALAAEERIHVEGGPLFREFGGVRVLPVFVFCLGNGGYDTTGIGRGHSGSVGKYRPARLFEDSSPFAAAPGGDAVLVLQSEGSATVPFSERGERLRVPLYDSTQAVVAGLLRSLHGTSPPDHWWPSAQQYPVLDLSWAHGFHPFAPFGFGGSVPGQLLADVASRNALISRAAVAAGVLSTAASALEDFAEAVIPSELIVGEERALLTDDGGATRPEWRHVWKAVAEVAGLPVHVIESIHREQGELCRRVDEFENTISLLRGSDFDRALGSMEGLRKSIETTVRATSGVAAGMRELQWCRCTTELLSNSAHKPWIVYLIVLLSLFYGLVRLVTAARRALLMYATTNGPGPGASW